MIEIIPHVLSLFYHSISLMTFDNFEYVPEEVVLIKTLKISENINRKWKQHYETEKYAIQ